MASPSAPSNSSGSAQQQADTVTPANPTEKTRFGIQIDAVERQSHEDRTIYNASAREIFWKNFLAGIGRGFGMALVQLLLYIGIFALTASILYPILAPLVSSLPELGESFSNSINQLQQYPQPQPATQ